VPNGEQGIPTPGFWPWLMLGGGMRSNVNFSKAKTAYQDFLTLWKDADPDIPVLIVAKSDYSKLK
jgi:hypothetical protein